MSMNARSKEYIDLYRRAIEAKKDDYSTGFGWGFLSGRTVYGSRKILEYGLSPVCFVVRPLQV